VFEAIALKTALILFEGQYSGIVAPERHYIPLRKDFGNVKDVFERLRDDAYLVELTERAYRDVVASGRFSYRAFIRELDDFIEKRVSQHNEVEFVLGVVGVTYHADDGVRLQKVRRGDPRSCATSAPVPRPKPELQLGEGLSRTLYKIKRAALTLQKHPFLFRCVRKLYHWTRGPFSRWLG
jgi:hypothetical protein